MCLYIRKTFCLDSSIANVYQNSCPHLSSAVQLFCTIKAYLYMLLNPIYCRPVQTDSELSDTPNVRYLVALYMRPTKTQISLRIRSVWSESSMGTLWIANGVKCFFRWKTKTLVRQCGYPD